MARLGLLNGRLRGFFDVWSLARHFDFDGSVLASAIRETFARRGLEIDPDPVALTAEFAKDPARTAQWNGFLRKNRLEAAPLELAGTIEGIATFLGPVVVALHESREFSAHWHAPGPWTTS